MEKTIDFDRIYCTIFATTFFPYHQAQKNYLVQRQYLEIVLGRTAGLPL